MKHLERWIVYLLISLTWWAYGGHLYATKSLGQAQNTAVALIHAASDVSCSLPLHLLCVKTLAVLRLRGGTSGQLRILLSDIVPPLLNRRLKITGHVYPDDRSQLSWNVCFSSIIHILHLRGDVFPKAGFLHLSKGQSSELKIHLNNAHIIILTWNTHTSCIQVTTH